jgi:hypothetical protein
MVSSSRSAASKLRPAMSGDGVGVAMARLLMPAGTPPPILIPPVAGGKVYGLPIAQFQVRCIIKVTCRQRY